MNRHYLQSGRKVALTVNTLGTLKVIQLCRKLPQLKCVVHVSTGYSNCDLTHIEEKVYRSQFSASKVIDALEWVPEKALDMITPILIGSKPNTYTFTKQLAENLFVEENESRELPYVIVRPTIVGATLKEPFRGWIDNYSGASGLFVACGMGLLRSMMAYPDAVANLLPVDIVTDIVIGAPWYREEHKRRRLEGLQYNYSQPNIGITRYSQPPTEDIESIRDDEDSNLVINCDSGYIASPLVWDTVPKLIEKFYCENPLERAVRYPRFRVTNSRLKNYFYTMFSHHGVAMIMDLLLRCTGQRPKLARMYKKLHQSLQSLEYFTQQYWHWEVNNLKQMDILLETVRRKETSSIASTKENPSWATEWNVSMQGIDWSKYMEFYCLGTKKFVMKEEMSKIGTARRRIRMLKLIHYLMISLSTVISVKLTHLICKLVIKVYRIVQSTDIMRALLPKIKHVKKIQNSVTV
ncbi:fatty acyl-CoA reductase 1-like [Convolutriloba macropyga]|uniref:fatty acyl-CoA reductase 1-like n=1 Tax=Convolutriloba macropyga TaxID=536237 RepID=UPI003F5268EB